MNAHVSSNRSRRKAVIFSIMAIALATLAWTVRTHVSVTELMVHEERFRAAIEFHPWRSFVLGFCVYAGLSLIPGTGGKAIVYGWFFGFWRAMIIVIVGLTFAAMVIFSLSRYFFRDHVERRYTDFLILMNKHIAKEGAFYLLTLRMAHAPFSIINPVSGASRIRTWTFFWTTVVGLLPGTAVWVYVGVCLPSLRDLTNGGPGSLVDPVLIAALLVSATLPALVRALVSRFGIPFSASPDATTSNHDNRGSSHGDST